MSSSSLFLRVALRRLARRASLGHVGEPTEERSPSPQRAARRPPTPCEHDAPVGDDLDVPARSDLLGVRDLHAERTALRRLDLRDPPLPPEYSTGSVNSRNTVSGDASIVIVRSMTLVS